MWTTASLFKTNISYTIPPSKPSSTSSATQWNLNLWTTSTSWVSTSTSNNAPSPTCNLPNPGKSGIPPPPGASAWLCQASNPDFTPFENTHFPPSSAEAAAAELVRLYVQKGHNHHACHRFLKTAPKTATCVCPPLDKGFLTANFPPQFYRQGGREDLQGSAQRSSLQDPRSGS